MEKSEQKRKNAILSRLNLSLLDKLLHPYVSSPNKLHVVLSQQELPVKRQQQLCDELPKPCWVKVGRVWSIIAQPVMWFSEKTLAKTVFGFFGPYTDDYKCKPHNNIIFVYDDDTKCVVTKCNSELNIFYKETNVENKVILQTALNQLLLDVDDIMRSNPYIKCYSSFSEKFRVSISGIDCGPEAAKWISRALGKENIRLAFTVYHPNLLRRKFWESIKNKFINTGSCDERDITVFNKHLNYFGTAIYTYINTYLPFSDLPPYSLISINCLNTLQSQCAKDKFSMNSMIHNPNIVIKTTDYSFHENEYEWIKIGKDVIMRNINPFPFNKDDSTFYIRDMPLDMKAKLLPIHCELYQSGPVNIDDDVCVHVANVVEIE
ncbi:uncharacterized protein LOC105181750 isoform X2 [Harpegnathos saltator]|uniref:uncharacterized protein LOC105181750 isoform X2 n=1 Tax=Harpegnathos saltator TaxID=610380 RepID=UPI000DBEEAB3|nr:uncharacterized protein LOC105181750 isoform X2 [Harpegnathos saltator]